MNQIKKFFSILAFSLAAILSTDSFAADTAQKSEIDEVKISSEQEALLLKLQTLSIELTNAFKQKLDLFGTKTILEFTKDEQAILKSFAHYHGFYQNDSYVCLCSNIIDIRAQGMATIVKEVERSIADAEFPIVAFLFLGSGGAITEYIMLDTLLQRNKNLRVAIDFIDPLYDDPSEKYTKSLIGKTKYVVNILLKSLMEKYPEQVIEYQLRNDNFSFLPELSESIPFVFYEPADDFPSQLQELTTLKLKFKNHFIFNGSRALNRPSSILGPNFLMHASTASKKIMVLAGFDLEDINKADGLYSFEHLNAVLRYAGQYEAPARPKRNLSRIFQKAAPWHVMSILVAKNVIQVINPLLPAGQP